MRITHTTRKSLSSVHSVTSAQPRPAVTRTRRGPTLRMPPCHGPSNPRAFLAFHVACEHRRILSPPIDGYGASAREQRDDQQVLPPCESPVDGQPDWPRGRELDEGLQEGSVRQVPELQPCIMEPPRQALGRRLLIPKATGQLGSTASLLVKNGLHKVPDAFALRTMCPG